MNECSSFTCLTSDAAQNLKTGSPINKQAILAIDARGSDVSKCKVSSISTSGYDDIPVMDEVIKNGKFKAKFLPFEVGRHAVSVLVNGEEHVGGSPFICNIYNNVTQVLVSGLGSSKVGQPVTLTVDASQAGEGTLELVVTTVTSSVKADVRARSRRLCDVTFIPQEAISDFVSRKSDGSKQITAPAVNSSDQVPTSAQAHGLHTYAISFTPKEALPHETDLKINGENVPGSPFVYRVIDSRQVKVSGEGPEKTVVNRQASFFIDVQGQPRTIEVRVLSPNRPPVPSSIKPISESHYSVSYTPAEVGDHTVEVKNGELPIHRSPFTAKAYDSTKVLVTDVRNGDVVGKSVYFNLDASQAGAGNLEIIVSVNGRREPNYVQSEGNAKFKISFKTREPILHMLSVRFNNEGDGDVLEYYPMLLGKYRFSVLYRAEAIPGSPIVIIFVVEAERLANAHGEGLHRGIKGVTSTFCVDARGVGEPTVQIDGPGSICECNIAAAESIELFRVTYPPQEVGIFDVRVLWNGNDILGSPFQPRIINPRKVRVIGGWESLMDSKDKLSLTVGEDKEISFDTVDVGPDVLLAEMGGPSGIVLSEAETTIPHLASSAQNERSLNSLKSGASSISSTGSGGDQKVILSGKGLARAICGIEAEFTIDNEFIMGKEIKSFIDTRSSGPECRSQGASVTVLPPLRLRGGARVPIVWSCRFHTKAVVCPNTYDEDVSGSTTVRELRETLDLSYDSGRNLIYLVLEGGRQIPMTVQGETLASYGFDGHPSSQIMVILFHEGELRYPANPYASLTDHLSRRRARMDSRRRLAIAASELRRLLRVACQLLELSTAVSRVCHQQLRLLHDGALAVLEFLGHRSQQLEAAERRLRLRRMCRGALALSELVASRQRYGRQRRGAIRLRRMVAAAVDVMRHVVERRQPSVPPEHGQCHLPPGLRRDLLCGALEALRYVNARRSLVMRRPGRASRRASR